MEWSASDNGISSYNFLCSLMAAARRLCCMCLYSSLNLMTLPSSAVVKSFVRAKCSSSLLVSLHVHTDTYNYYSEVLVGEIYHRIGMLVTETRWSSLVTRCK